MGIAALLLAWAAAIVVYASAPSRTANRALAIVIAMEGTGVGLARGVSAFVTDVPTEYGITSAIILCQLILPVAYLVFVSRLDSPLARSLRRWPVLVVAAVSLGGLLYFLQDPSRIDTVYLAAFRGWTALGLLGLAVALTVLWRAPRGSATRAQAKAYSWAFGIRDVGWFSYVWWLFPTFGASADPRWQLFFSVYAPSITLVFIGLLGYGILKTQMLDIDLRLKWTISRGTIGAAFVLVFLVVAQLVQNVTTARLGLLGGAIAAALLLFALRPLERAATRVADVAMPRVVDTAEYRTVRRREVYRAAVESALVDGEITVRERGILATLADELGISAREAHELEQGAARTAV